MDGTDAEARLRVLVVEDDADTAEYTRTVLERRGGMLVRVVVDPQAALELIGDEGRDFDLLLTDIRLPGMSGLELVAAVRSRSSDLPIIVMTAYASVDHAVEALRLQAGEFLTKPVPAAILVERVTALATEGRAARRKSRRSQRPPDVVLAVGAHPDDVEIGVGGTLAAHRSAGDQVVILTMSRGARGGDADVRQLESLAAAEIIGARLFLEDLEDTRILADGDAVRIVEGVVGQARPTIVYTHSEHDRHQDHRAVHRAVAVAARRVPTFACYESPSATVDFRPNRFVPIDLHLETKLAMLAKFVSQGHRDYLEPDMVRATARYWSRFGGGTSCEPFEVLREMSLLGGSRGETWDSASVEEPQGSAFAHEGGEHSW